MATGRIPTTANSPLTAKGDLFTFSTGSAKLAVGNDGETLVADSSTSTGLRYAEDYAAGKNKIINGNLAVNQRAFTSNTTSGLYNFDRFLEVNSGGTVTVTPQLFTAGAAPVAGYEATNYVRVVTASQSAAGDYALFGQKIEDVRTLAGQTATVSFWAKAATGTPKIGIVLDQYFGTGGSASATVTNAAATQTITTSWVRYSFTITVPSISGKTIGTANNSSLSLYVVTSTGATLVAAGYPNTGVQNITVDMWGFQVEQGSTATAFQTATGTIQGELAACQRYYVRWGGGSLFEFIGLGTGTTSTVASISVNMPVQMRIPPTTIDYSTLSLFDGTSTITSAVPTIVASYSGTKIMGIDATVASGVTVNRPYRLITNNSTSGFLGLSAEL
jgi:hypothetical protein